MTISNSPRVIGDTGDIQSSDLKLVVEFVLKNRALLEAHWNQEPEYEGTQKVLNAIESIK